MSKNSIWTLLGIEPTRDPAEVRRAYAQRLKVTNPEDDADGFQALRAAYEQALRYVRAPVGVDLQPVAPTAWAPKPADAADRVASPDTCSAAAPDAGPPEIDPAISEHQKARTQLQRLARAPNAGPEGLVDALQALLAGRAMDSVSEHMRTEAWLASLIQANAPRTDPLIPIAVARFGWDRNRISRDGNLGAGVIARRDDLAFLDASRKPAHHHHGAYLALNQKPSGRRLWRNSISPTLPGEVGTYLAIIRRERPGAERLLDPEALAWWERRLARPHLGPVSIYLTVFLPFVLGIVLAGQAPLNTWAQPLGAAAAYGAALIIVLTPVVLRFYALAWPRVIFRRLQIRNRALSLLLRIGWAPALLILVLAAGLIPPSPGSRIGLGAAATLAGYWAAITGDPDRRDWGRPWRVSAPGGPALFVIAALILNLFYVGVLRPNTRYPWQVRVAFSYAYLAVFIVAFWAALPDTVRSAMFTPVLAAVAAFSWGGASLVQAWRTETPTPLRRWSLPALTACTAGLLLQLRLSIDDAAIRPAVFAGFCVLLLAHKPIATPRTDVAYNIRHLGMKAGILWAPVLAAITCGPTPPEYWMAGLWVSGGVAAAIVGAVAWSRPSWWPLSKRRIRT